MNALRAIATLGTFVAIFMGLGALDKEPVNYIYVLGCMACAAVMTGVCIWLAYISERSLNDGQRS